MVTVRSIESHRNYDNNNKKAKMIKYQEHLHLIEMQSGSIQIGDIYHACVSSGLEAIRRNGMKKEL